MANQEGFAKIRNGIREHIKQGKLTPQDLGVYLYLHLECNWTTGIYHGTALGIAFGFDNPRLKTNIQQSLARLRQSGFINFRKGDGTHKGYDILIHKFEPQGGKLKDQRLDAWKHGDKVIPAYEPLNGGQTEDKRNASGTPAVDAPIPEVKEVSDVPEVTEVPSGDDRTERFAETQGDPVNPKEQPLATFLEGIDGDDEPLPSVHSPAPQVRMIPPGVAPVAKIVRRDKGHRWAQTTNGLKCLACKTGWMQYERDRRACPNEEMDIDAVDTPQPVPPPAPVKEIPKPDPADYDMEDRFSRPGALSPRSSACRRTTPAGQHTWLPS